MRPTYLRTLVAALLACSPASAQTAPRPSGAAELVAEAERLRHTDAEATFRLTQQALPLLRGPADTEPRMRALVLRCWAAAVVAPDSVLAHAERGMADAARHRDARALAQLRVCRGHGREQAGLVVEALRDFDFGAAEGERLGSRELRAEALVLRGELRYYRGEYTAAVADLSTAHRLFTALGDLTQQRYALNAIANLYADSRVAQYERALEYYRQVLASHQAAGSERGVATTHFNLGGTLERMGRLDDALAQYRRGLAMDLKRGDPGEAAVDRRAIGALLAQMGRPAEALVELDRALAWFRRSGDPERVAQARLSRGIALRMLGRTGEALAELEAARARFQATGNRRFLERVHEERAAALASAGRWREAYRAAAEQVVLQRALGDQARDEHTSRLRVQFDAEKKEQENRALLRENALRGEALAAGVRIRRLQVAVLALSAVVIAALVLLAVRQVRSARRLRMVALTDELTRLPNRRHLLMLAGEQVRAAREQGSGFAVLALDVDHFKRVNDAFGHDVGDAVLRRVAAALRSALRGGDHVGRTGGEEFVAVLPGADDDAAARIAETVRGSVERTGFGDLHPGLVVTISVGAAVREPGDADFAATLKRADDALYLAKSAGRNRVELAGGAVATAG